MLNLLRNWRWLVRKPFDGADAYEWQIGAIVLQWLHKPRKDGSRLNVWHDPFWTVR